MVLIERGWWDQFVDPTRYRLPPGFGGVRLLGHLTPKADLVVHVSGDLSEVHRRKPELELSEALRQDREWATLRHRIGRESLRVDTTCSFDETSLALSGVAEALSDDRWALAPVRPAPRRLKLAASEARGAASSVYRPQTRRALLSHKVAQRLHGRLRRNRIAALAAVTAEAAGLRSSELFQFRGSAEGRRVVGLVGAGSSVVIKVNDVPDPGLSAEMTALAWRDVPVQRPDVVAAGHVAGISYLVTEKVVPGSEAQVSVADAVGVAAVLQTMAEPVVHGDLAPWNLIRCDGGLVLLDWESAARRSSPLYDAAYFVIATGAMLGRWDARGAARVLREEVVPVLGQRLAHTPLELFQSLPAVLRELENLPDRRSAYARACREALT